METTKNKSVEEKEYIKNFFKKKEEELTKKAEEIFEDIKKDLDKMKDLPEYKKEEILQNIRDYANYSVYAFDCFMRSKNVD